MRVIATVDSRRRIRGDHPTHFIHLEQTVHYQEAAAVLEAQVPAAIQRFLLSEQSAERLAVARQLKSTIKLTRDIHELSFMAEILMSVVGSDDPEVLEGIVRCLARFATEAWPVYEELCQAHGAETRLMELIGLKHQAIRAAAAHALVATALHTERLESIAPLLNHPSPRLVAAAIVSISACAEAGLAIEELIPRIIERLSGAHKRVAKAIVHTVTRWVEAGPACQRHYENLGQVQAYLEASSLPRSDEMIEAIRQYLESHIFDGDVEAVFARLYSPDAERREQAARRLCGLYLKGEITLEETTVLTEKALKHQDPQVRRGIAHAISVTEWKQSRHLTLLDHPDTAVRESARGVERSRNPQLSNTYGMPDVPDDDSEIDPRIQTLLRELFDRKMVEEWGWGLSFEPGWRTEAGALTTKVVSRIACAPPPTGYYTSATITIDLLKGTVYCLLIDQKTPAEHEWKLTPDSDWWAQAKACPTWPVGERG